MNPSTRGSIFQELKSSSALIPTSAAFFSSEELEVGTLSDQITAFAFPFLI